ncbi:MAG: hypothetical protein C4320_02915 [Armatimonadota bacterium]
MICDWRGILTKDLAQCHSMFFGELYEVDEPLFRLNTVDAPGFDWGASLVDQGDDGEIRAFIAFKRAPKAWRTSSPDALHLSTLGFVDAEAGFRVFTEAVNRIRDRGFDSIIYGMEERHFWPGVPISVSQINTFLELQGFEFGGEYFDLERDLLGFTHATIVPQEAELRVLTSQDIPSLEAFFLRTFPGRWHRTVMEKVMIEGRAGTVFGLLIQGEVEGFALLQDSRAKLPIGGAVWKQSLGENWCSLGPIGVSERVRGGGYGGALLAEALRYLAEQGGRRCIIDWTTLDAFYGKYGFVPTRRYRSARLEA